MHLCRNFRVSSGQDGGCIEGICWAEISASRRHRYRASGHSSAHCTRGGLSMERRVATLELLGTQLRRDDLLRRLVASLLRPLQERA